jgi:hypothetical protein
MRRRDRASTQKVNGPSNFNGEQAYVALQPLVQLFARQAAAEFLKQSSNNNLGLPRAKASKPSETKKAGQIHKK